MRSYPNTTAGMKAAQRAYDAQEHPDYYDPPRRRRDRTITLATGEEISDAEVSDPAPDEEETD